MSLKAAIIYDDGGVYVELPPDVFKALLKEYLNEYASVDKAIDRIIFDLKKKTLYK